MSADTGVHHRPGDAIAALRRREQTQGLLCCLAGLLAMVLLSVQLQQDSAAGLLHTQVRTSILPGSAQKVSPAATQAWPMEPAVSATVARTRPQSCFF